LVCDTTIRLCTPYKYNSDTDNVAIAAIFKAKDKKSTMVCIATVHLFWNPYYPEIKVTQTQQVLQSLHCFLQQHDMTHIPVVLAGDLNSTPNSPVYELISNDQGLALKSAYSTLSNAKVNAPTNYTPHFVDCIDYVFFSDHMLKPVSLLGEPASVDLYDNIALPNRFYSSDHIAVGTELIFDCSVTQDSSGM
jgi:CCR4-NOT transcription complex subunit 6